MQSEFMSNFMMVVRSSDDEMDATLYEVQSLVARARTGDVDAFEKIIIRYQRQVLGTATRLLGNIDDARDAAQEVFLRLHKYLDRFDAEKEFLPWLYRMTVNVCRDVARKRGPSSTVSIDQDCENEIAEFAIKQDIEEKISAQQERKIITEAIASLPEKERAAIVLRDIEGLETKEVARLLGTSEATVRSQISMARIKIKKYRDKVLGK